MNLQCPACGSYGDRHVCEYCGTILNNSFPSLERMSSVFSDNFQGHYHNILTTGMYDGVNGTPRVGKETRPNWLMHRY